MGMPIGSERSTHTLLNRNDTRAPLPAREAKSKRQPVRAPGAPAATGPVHTAVHTGKPGKMCAQCVHEPFLGLKLPPRQRFHVVSPVGIEPTTT